jgi:hypothetical protein
MVQLTDSLGKFTPNRFDEFGFDFEQLIKKKIIVYFSSGLGAGGWGLGAGGWGLGAGGWGAGFKPSN